MSKMTDKKCQDCTNYDNCDKDSSAGCDSYEYYKCKDCVDRVTETDDCLRFSEVASRVLMSGSVR